MSACLERIKVLLWRCTKGMAIRFRYRQSRKERESYTNVLDSRQTIDYILTHRCPVARFGDGEFQMIEHGRRSDGPAGFNVDTFQSFDKELSDRLYEVLTQPVPNLLVCVSYPLFHSEVYYGYDRTFLEREWLGRGKYARLAANRHEVVGDATFTRFYMHRRDIKDYPSYLSSMKGIWEGRETVLIEGEKSRLGVGNDLFDNAASVKRIICPSTDAFSVYDKIVEQVVNMNRKDCLFLLALGHTATVLACDLSKRGFEAIDIGHVDIEYEWYRMGAKDKCPVPGKYVNEVREGRQVGEAPDNDYDRQIIIRIV